VLSGWRGAERYLILIISVCSVTLFSENIQINTHIPDVTASKNGDSPCLHPERPSQVSPTIVVGVHRALCMAH
jgi:hypothetical protein